MTFRPTHDVGPRTQCISGLNHAAYGLPVNASRPGSPQAHASLGSGWRPTLAGWDWIPTGFRTRFRRSHHGILSPLTGLSRHTRWCTGIDAPICQDKRLGCLRDVSAHAEVGHNTLVDFTGEEAFEAADDLASGPAASRPAGDVVDRRLVEPHADDDRAMEGGVRLSVPAPIETMPAGRHPGRSRDRAGTAPLRKGGF